MNKYFLRTPVGVKDYTLNTMEKKNKIETTLRELYLNSGYNLVETPTFEYIDVFQNGEMQMPELYKFINNQGEILALRSDLTKSIARVVSTETKNILFPQRFCYVANCFRYPKVYQGRLHEFTQAGVELIGCDGLYADYEIVSLAVKSLDSVLNSYKLHISSTEFFNNYLDDLKVDEKLKEEILFQIQKKNVVKIKQLLNEKEFEIVSLITESIGKIELLKKIKEKIVNQKTMDSLCKLEKLYYLLEKNKLEKNVFFDFSVLSFGTYYTGLTLQGYTKGVGTPILDGGRYDNLIGNFGEKKSAIGFAIDVNEIIDKTYLTYEKELVLLFSKNKENLTSEKGLISLEETLEDAMKYGIINNIKTLVDYDNKKTYVLKEGVYIWQE